jgi:hypothetical protein
MVRAPGAGAVRIVGVAAAVRIVGVNVLEVEQHLAVGDGIIPHHLVVVRQRAAAGAIRVTGHQDEASLGELAAELVHRQQVLVHLGFRVLRLLAAP